MKINSIIDLVKDLDTSRQTKNLNKLLIRILLHLQVEFSTDIRQMGGYPEYKGTPYVDTDGDGMPDEWEIANGLNPNDPSDANKDCTGDGYTNIEKYINGISTKNKVDWTDMKNNYDTLAEKGKLM